MVDEHNQAANRHELVKRIRFEQIQKQELFNLTSKSKLINEKIVNQILKERKFKIIKNRPTQLACSSWSSIEIYNADTGMWISKFFGTI